MSGSGRYESLNNYSNVDLIVRCDQLKNKSSRRVTYGNPCYSIGSKTNSIYFLNDLSVYYVMRSKNKVLCAAAGRLALTCAPHPSVKFLNLINESNTH
jgi:hypothetical protein